MTSIHNLSLAEEMYEKYKSDPLTCESSWRFFFEGMEWGVVDGKGILSKEMRIAHLIDAYRTFGHLLAKVNPIETKKRVVPHPLSLETLGFQEGELKELFPTAGLLRKEMAPLESILEELKLIYGGTVSIEYMHTTLPEMKKWLQEQIEPTRFHPPFTTEKKREIFQWLNQATLFETFLHTRYVGQKRFSLEGGETLLPILHEVIETGASHGMEEVVIGMAHRGRLNVLTGIMNKSMGQVFGEFEDHYDPSGEASGDVKYHKGYSTNVKTESGKEIHISMTSNPSHLESVCPVVEGKTKARQILRGDRDKREVIPVLIHGDASIAGQGVVYETMQLYNLPGYSTGGTVHIIINNQIGFTTLPHDSRSTPYCTTIAGAFAAPVFHVNAEDPEGCVYAAKLALLIRQKWHIDVFIDMNCYRKFGHNEGDEPAFTQPLEYELIRKKNSIREIYLTHLVEEGVITAEESQRLEKEFKEALAIELEEVKRKREPIQEEAFGGAWEGFRKGDVFEPTETAVNQEQLVEAATLFSKMPEGFSLHPKVAKLFSERLQMVVEGEGIDYACAEHLAMATLLLEGISVRLAGQDSRRGTFSQRHALWVDQKTGHAHIPLAHMKEGQGRFDVIDSPLSEYAALGFEFGYTLTYPQALVMWEAQYGDFVNGAQIMIDQYIAAAEQKWNRHSGLVMLLPHGYEGSGPEHSSARLERFLQLSGDQNIQVAYPTTPAQIFHLLRRQVLRQIRKPLVVMTPKGMLRHPLCKSRVEEFEKGGFHEVIDDEIDRSLVKKILLCSGKIYYELLEERKKRQEKSVAIVRIEQLYPLDEKELKKVLKGYEKAERVVWVQEEPENMGAWWALQGQLTPLIPEKIEFQHVTRKQSASVAVGSHALHVKEQQELIRRAYE